MTKTTTVATLLAVLITVTCGMAQAEPELVRGETYIEVAAVGNGLCVHNLFQSNMVLQRGKPIAVWGWATARETVAVSFGGAEAKATAGDDGSWKISLPAMEASSESRKMTIKGKEKTLTLVNILIGDVWVLGGQSNMEHPISRIEDGALEIASANFPNIRIMTVPKQNGPDAHPSFPRQYQWNDWFKQHDRQGYWDVCSPTTVRDLSGIGYVFARRLYMATQVPIGVIDASVGGTTVETWTADAELRKMDDPLLQEKIAVADEKAATYSPEQSLADRIKLYNDRTERLRKEGNDVSDRTNPPTTPGPDPSHDKNRPGNCYAGMIAPLAGLAVKGAIWHQGYNNCFDGTPGAVMYRRAFPEMIKSWRQAFGNSEMAFCIISLCTQGKKQERDDFTSHMADVGPFIREAQYQTFLEFYEAGDQNIGFVSTYDLDRRWYHPGLKVPAGERTAKWALKTQYGIEAGKWTPPMITEMKVEDHQIVLKLDVDGGTVDNGLPTQGFAIAGKDRAFHPADATFLVTSQDSRGRPKYDRKVIVLTSSMVPSPAHYRYAWARMPMANVQHGQVILATQRSDDWPLEQTPAGLFGDNPPAKLDGRQMGTLMKALKAADLRRRLAEAKALIEENNEEN